MPELEDVFGTPADPPDATPEPQAVEPLPSAPSEPSFSSSGLYARAQAAGLPLDGVDSPDRFAEVLLDRYMAEQPYAQHGRSSLAQGNKLQAAPQDDGGSDEAQGDVFDLDGHFSSLWTAPQIDDQAKFLISSGIVALSEDGLYAAKPGYEAVALPVLNALNQAHVAQKEQVQKLFEGNFYQNLDKGLWPAVEHRVQKMLEERLGQQFQSYHQEQQAQSFEQKFIEQHKSWLHDANGRLTQKGVEFQQAVLHLRERGMTDPAELAEWATLRIGGVPQAAPGQAPSNGTPSAPPADAGRPRDEHGRYLPAGMPAPVGPPKTKQESFIDSARRQAAASSNQSSYSDAGGDATVANDGELENMFNNAWRKHTAGAAA